MIDAMCFHKQWLRVSTSIRRIVFEFFFGEVKISLNANQGNQI